MLRALGREAHSSDLHKLALKPGVSAYEWLSVGSSHGATRKPVPQLSSTKCLCSHLGPDRLQVPKGTLLQGYYLQRETLLLSQETPLGNFIYSVDTLRPRKIRFSQWLLSPKNRNPQDQQPLGDLSQKSGHRYPDLPSRPKWPISSWPYRAGGRCLWLQQQPSKWHF